MLSAAERKKFAWLTAGDTLISLLDILSLAMLLWVIQFYVQPSASGYYSLLPSWMADSHSIGLIAVFFLFFGLKSLAGIWVARQQFRFLATVAVRVSENKLSQYQQMPFDEYVSTDSSQFIRKIALQPFEFCQHLLAGFQQVITQTVLITVSIAAILAFNARLFFFLLLMLLPPILLIFYILRKKLAASREQLQERNERSYQHLLDALKGYVEGNVFGRNLFFRERFIRQRKAFSKHLFESLSLQQLPGRVIEMFAILGLFLLIGISIGANKGATGAFLTIGAFMAAAYKIIPGIVKIININSQLRAYEWSLPETEPESRSSAAPVTGIDQLEVRNLHFRFPDKKILHSLSFSAHRGELVGISGISGRGKTTLFNILLGFLSPHEGAILFNKKEVVLKDIASYWPHISYVKQQPFFLHDSLARNITLEEKTQRASALSDAISGSGVSAILHQFPEADQLLIAENGRNISGGQQQRVAIARALYKPADLYLLDEPFNELDPAAINEILDHLRTLARSGKIVLLITHDQHCLSRCDKIVSLDVS